jgi:very-short-patch-repair endonuclease
LPKGIYKRSKVQLEQLSKRLSEYNKRHTSKQNKRRWKDPAYRKFIVAILAKQRATARAKAHCRSIAGAGGKASAVLPRTKAQKKASLHNLKRAALSPNYNSHKHRKRQRALMKMLWRTRRADLLHKASPAIRALRSRTMKHLFRIGRLQHRSPSKIQVAAFRFLCAKGVKNLKLNLLIGTYRIDIAVVRKKIAIEIDGEYWHKIKNTKRDRFLRSRGWKVIHIPVPSNYKKQLIFNKVFACASV